MLFNRKKGILVDSEYLFPINTKVYKESLSPVNKTDLVEFIDYSLLTIVIKTRDYGIEKYICLILILLRDFNKTRCFRRPLAKEISLNRAML